MWLFWLSNVVKVLPISVTIVRSRCEAYSHLGFQGISLDYWFFAAMGVLLFDTCFWALRLRDLLQNLFWVPTIKAEAVSDSSGDVPLISIIVPAHNEQAGIRDCLRSVLDQDYPACEVILVDDRSEDMTASIAQEVANGRSDFKIVTVRELPAGWTGKCHALDAGVRHSSGQWLAFLDADSTLHRSALLQCYRTAMQHGVNMITLSPQFIVNTFWEKALQPTFAAMSCILFPLAKINDPGSSVASANGMFYLISRSAYDKIGGHHDVKGLAVEDIGIGKRIKATGLGLLFANGRKVLRTRMYTGLGEILGGWTRILSASMNYELTKVLKYLCVHLLMSPVAAILALSTYLASAASLFPDSWFVFLLPAGFVLTAAVVPYWYCAELGIPRKYSGLMCIGNLFLIWVFLVIIKKIIMKDALQWRGTTYATSLYEPTRLNPTGEVDAYGSSGPRFVHKIN